MLGVLLRRAYLPAVGLQGARVGQRCHEILAHFRAVQEWMEVAILSEPRAATARNFLAIPEGATLSSRPVTKAQLLN
jgi:hypothetical protein